MARGTDEHPVAGHCAIATEALYDLLGGAAAGYTAFVCGYYYDADGTRHYGNPPAQYEKMTHWWLRAPLQADRGKGKVLDLTSEQYTFIFPYKNGRATGFMSPTPPSKRARVLIARIEEKLGAQNIALFRQTQIDSFNAAGGHVKLGKADQKRRLELQKRILK